MGARVSFSRGKPKVSDGPFAEAKEVLGGYWMIQVKSKGEGETEVRQMFWPGRHALQCTGAKVPVTPFEKFKSPGPIRNQKEIHQCNS